MSHQRLILALLVGTALVFSCAHQGAKVESDEAVKQAKAVVRSHEESVQSANLDEILSNCDDDIVVLIPNAPLVVGKAATRSMYETLFQAGTSRGEHQYHGAVAIGDLVVLHGVCKGTMTAAQGQAAAFANNFILTLRKGADGKYRFWRVAFAPDAAAADDAMRYDRGAEPISATATNR